MPWFTKESVDKEQGIIGQEIRMYEDSPDWRVMENMFAAMFSEHPIKVNIAGTVESIAEITHETLYDCHRAFYAPSNMALCVAGNVTRADNPACRRASPAGARKKHRKRIRQRGFLLCVQKLYRAGDGGLNADVHARL